MQQGTTKLSVSTIAFGIFSAAAYKVLILFHKSIDIAGKYLPERKPHGESK